MLAAFPWLQRALFKGSSSLNGRGSTGPLNMLGFCKSSRASVTPPALVHLFFNYSSFLKRSFFSIFKKHRTIWLSWAASILLGSFIIVCPLNGKWRVSFKRLHATSLPKYINSSLMELGLLSSDHPEPDSSGKQICFRYFCTSYYHRTSCYHFNSLLSLPWFSA